MNRARPLHRVSESTATNMTHRDLIVVGLGAMGSAALRSAAESGASVLGIDRYSPPHRFGSSSAESRITRLAIGEGPQYLPFVARSHEIWRDLEARSGHQLLYQPGGYTLCPPSPAHLERWGNFVTQTQNVARDAGLSFERRTRAEFSAHLPAVTVTDEMIGFEPTGGIVLSELAVDVQLRLARASGAEIVTDTAVTGVEPTIDGAVVIAGGRTFTADRVIVTTGPWFSQLAPPVDAAGVEVTRQVVFWFEADDPSRYSADHFPFLIWAGDRAEDYLGVFPIVPGGTPGLKVLGEQFTDSTTVDIVDRAVTDDEIRSFHERFVAPRLDGVTNNCVRAEVCLYTNTPDDHFLIDHHPESEHVVYASPCSGHGFKHSAALGEALAQLTTSGASDLDLRVFGRDRLV